MTSIEREGRYDNVVKREREKDVCAYGYGAFEAEEINYMSSTNPDCECLHCKQIVVCSPLKK